jgi:hypothetical protein
MSPFIEILRGDPDETELAALVMALVSLPAAEHTPQARPVLAGWSRPPFAGPASWQTIERRGQ